MNWKRKKNKNLSGELNVILATAVTCLVTLVQTIRTYVCQKTEAMTVLNTKHVILNEEVVSSNPVSVCAQYSPFE